MEYFEDLVGDPATLLVLGFEGSGKTSFINTMLRWRGSGMCPLAPEDRYKVCHACDSMLDAGDVTLRVVDSPPVTLDTVGLARLTRVLERGVYDMMGVDGADEAGWERVACDCVVIVVNCRNCDMDDLKKLADVVHESKLPLVVAVTNKDRAEPRWADDFIEEVAETCYSEVFFFKNCVKRCSVDIDTKQEIEALLRQAASYIIRRRINMILYHKEQVTEGEDEAEEKGEAEEKDEAEESDDDMGFSLFD